MIESARRIGDSVIEKKNREGEAHNDWINRKEAKEALEKNRLNQSKDFLNSLVNKCEQKEKERVALREERERKLADRERTARVSENLSWTPKKIW